LQSFALKKAVVSAAPLYPLREGQVSRKDSKEKGKEKHQLICNLLHEKPSLCPLLLCARCVKKSLLSLREKMR